MTPLDEGSSGVGAVVIGRNEGDRLKRCLESLMAKVACVVYVDSGSTDGSPSVAEGLGAHVVALDLGTPFTAARARNAGIEALIGREMGIDLIQFVDGDCEVVAGWIESARAALGADRGVAVVCGRRRERFPGASVYNRLCDLEWDTPAGEARACGGDAMMRVEALEGVGGYDPTLIAGEEPELCVRLRARGWRILRIDAEMTLHDAAMTRFAQWWRRAKRAGHAYAEGAAIHGSPPERHGIREVRSILLWGAALPLTALVLAWPSSGLSLAGAAAVYGAQGWRIARGERRRGVSARDARTYAAFTLLGKLAQFQGVAAYRINRLRGRRTGIIEYKSVPAPGTRGLPAGPSKGDS
jgi:GT2 family glycosyltransferase